MPHPHPTATGPVFVAPSYHWTGTQTVQAFAESLRASAVRDDNAGVWVVGRELYRLGVVNHKRDVVVWAVFFVDPL